LCRDEPADGQASTIFCPSSLYVLRMLAQILKTASFYPKLLVGRGLEAHG
jgi:hypothetical protein